MDGPQQLLCMHFKSLETGVLKATVTLLPVQLAWRHHSCSISHVVFDTAEMNAFMEHFHQVHETRGLHGSTQTVGPEAWPGSHTSSEPHFIWLIKSGWDPDLLPEVPGLFNIMCNTREIHGSGSVPTQWYLHMQMCRLQRWRVREQRSDLSQRAQMRANEQSFL